MYIYTRTYIVKVILYIISTFLILLSVFVFLDKNINWIAFFLYWIRDPSNKSNILQILEETGIKKPCLVNPPQPHWKTNYGRTTKTPSLTKKSNYLYIFCFLENLNKSCFSGQLRKQIKMYKIAWESSIPLCLLLSYMIALCFMFYVYG